MDRLPKAPTPKPPTTAELGVVDMHTAGEPVRLLLEGYPELEGETLLEADDPFCHGFLL